MRTGARRKPGPPRVVFDAGVLLQGLLLSDARAQRLRLAWQGGACVPLIGAASAQLLMRALACPLLELDEAEQHELLADFLPYAEVVPAAAGSRATASPTLQLALARAARAELLVSDCTALRAKFSRDVPRSASPLCTLLGSNEFLATL